MGVIAKTKSTVHTGLPDTSGILVVSITNENIQEYTMYYSLRMWNERVMGWLIPGGGNK